MDKLKKAYCEYMQHCHAGIMPRAALLDMDGTLYDSMPLHVRAWMELFSEHGIEVEESEILLAEGRTGADTVRRIFKKYHDREVSDEECRSLYKRKAELFSALPRPDVMPGAQQLVSDLHDAGVITVLVTGSGQNTLLDRLESDFPGAFPPDRRVTAYNVTHGKPHPEPFLRGMAMAGVDPCQAIAFDNAPLGVESAAASGAFAVGVLTGPIPPESLAAAGAHVVFGSMPECAIAFRDKLQGGTIC